MPNLTSKNFKKMLSVKKTYLPKAVSRELKAAKMGGLLTGRGVSQAQAAKAVRYLKEKQLLATSKRPQQLFTTAIKKQQVEMDAIANQVRSRHVRANIALDIFDELAHEEKGKGRLGTYYQPSGGPGKQRVVDQVETARQQREKSAADELEKRNGPKRTDKASKKRPAPIELPPALDIG